MCGFVGFLLLEEVESSMGSAVQILRSLEKNLRPFMFWFTLVPELTSPLRSRLLRQEGVSPTIRADEAQCRNQKEGGVLLDLVQRCESVELNEVYVSGSLGA